MALIRLLSGDCRDVLPTLAERFCRDLSAMMEDAPYHGAVVWEDGNPARMRFVDGSMVEMGPTGRYEVLMR